MNTDVKEHLFIQSQKTFAVEQKGEKNMIKAEWTSADTLDLQPTCNQFATDCISRQAAIELIHSMYPSAPIMRINRKRWEEKYKPYIEAEKALGILPSVQPEIIACGDCKHWICHDRRCGYWNHGVKPLMWCSQAERREE